MREQPPDRFLGRRKAVGMDGEAVAAAHLARSGYEILERNVRGKYGEIDIIARERGCLVFVEVRTRRSRAMAPEESVTAAKQRRLAMLGEQYLAYHDLTDTDWRIDVIAIEQDQEGRQISLNHIVSAVSEPA